MRTNYKSNPINTKYVLVVLGIAIVLSLLTAKALADSEILQPNGAGKDTCIIAGSPNLNYGADIGMDIRGDDNRHSLIWFDLSSIPSNAIINSATLKLYATK